MYVAVFHRIKDMRTAFIRGEKLVANEGAPPGVRGLQFYPARDGSTITCLWDAPSVESVQGYVDEVLGEASENTCFEVDTEEAFAQQPAGIRATADIPA